MEPRPYVEIYSQNPNLIIKIIFNNFVIDFSV